MSILLGKKPNKLKPKLFLHVFQNKGTLSVQKCRRWYPHRIIGSPGIWDIQSGSKWLALCSYRHEVLTRKKKGPHRMLVLNPHTVACIKSWSVCYKSKTELVLKPSHRASARIYIFEETSCHSTKKEINNQNPKPQTHHPIVMKTSLLMNSIPMRLMDNRYFFPLLTRNPCDLSYRYVNCVPMSRWLWHAVLEVPFHFQAC